MAEDDGQLEMSYVCLLAFHLIMMDAHFFSFFIVKFHLPNSFLVSVSFYTSDTVHLICMFQSSKGFRMRALTCCLQNMEINVHTFLYV